MQKWWQSPGKRGRLTAAPELLKERLSQLELFLHDDHMGLPPLIRGGLVHVEFEAIHLFFGRRRKARALHLWTTVKSRIA